VVGVGSWVLGPTTAAATGSVLLVIDKFGLPQMFPPQEDKPILLPLPDDDDLLTTTTVSITYPTVDSIGVPTGGVSTY
jgi:hypothetical protein